MRNSEKLLKTLSGLIESGILTSKDIQKEITQFKQSFKDLIDVTDLFQSFDKDKTSEKNGAAVEYLEMFSYVADGFMWFKILEISYD